MLSALENCQHAGETLNDLIRKAPTATSVIHSLLRDTFKVDPLDTGLTVRHQGQHVFVSLACLAIHARKHAAVATSQYTHAKVHKLPITLGPVAHSPQQLLARLAMLDVPNAMRLQWDEYWQARAPGTPSSRWQLAHSQYLRHFKASLELGQAAQPLGKDPFSLVTAVLNNPEWKLINGKTVCIEMPGSAIGTLVFSQDAEGPAVLYQPGGAAAFSFHATRQALEEQLPAPANGGVAYQALEAISDGATKLLDNLLESTLQALDHDPGNDLAIHAPLALAQIEAIESTRLNPQIFYFDPLPDTDEADIDAGPPSLFSFGSLSHDASRSNRTHQIDRQLTLLTQLDESQSQDVNKLQRSLQTHCTQAEHASAELLSSSRWHSDAAPLLASPLLIEAHRQGLRLHAQIQYTLGQISQAQFNAVASVVDQGESLRPDDSEVITANVLIRQRSDADEVDDSQTWISSQALVIGSPSLLAETDSSPLLLYWIGEQGGLLNCASQVELEKCLGLDPEHESLTLQPMSGDVLATMLSQTLAKGRAQRQDIQDAEGTEGAAAAIPRIKETLLHYLQVPPHAARVAALELWQGQNQVLAFAQASAATLRPLPPTTRQALCQLAPHYTVAMQRAEALLTHDLHARDAFCHALIGKRLKLDMPEYDGSFIGLDLPRSVDEAPDLITGGTPGTVTRKTYKPSTERVKLTLENLLLTNIDEPTGRRLNYLNLDLTTTDSTIGATLTAKINRNYLQTLANDLDLAGAYEEQIHAAYRGLGESDFQADYRKETLLAPLQLMLAMQSLLSQGMGRLTDEGVAVMNIAIHASCASDYQADGHDIQLWPATLTPGGTDTDDKSTTLSGITFIENRTTGMTLLYLPEHKTHPLQQFSTLEAARGSLYERSNLEGEADYLAQRALLGDPLAHASRIREALRQDFSGVIGVGTAWPSTTSLAEHLLNSQMGDAIQAHRNTSRSNAELWLENFTHNSTLVYTYIKLALGFVPFVGSAIGVYDFLDSTARAVEAFSNGLVAEGLEALTDALAAMIEGAMDLATGVGINSLTLRKLARRRQLRPWLAGAAHKPTEAASRLKRVNRFAGYEYDQPYILDGLTADTQGRYRAIYRHSDGEFIKIGHLAYQVQWDATANTWRLKGTRRKSWQRAITLDDAGNWDTHFALYGTHLQGGGSGGGQALGHLAEQLDAYWPAAIRNQLPRFLVDRHYRQQRSLTSKAHADEARLLASIAHSNTLAQAQAPLAQLEAAFTADVDLARKSYQSWDVLLQVSLRRRQQMPNTQKGRSAKLICERLLNLIELRAQRSRARLAKIIAHHRALEEIQGLTDQLPLLRARRQLIIEQLKDREAMFKEMDKLGIWIKRAESDRQVHASFQQYQQHLSTEFKAFYDTPHLMQAALSRKHATVVAEYLLERLAECEVDIHRTRETLFGLQDVQATAQQRRHIYEQTRRAYSVYRQRLQSTFASMPALFDEHYLQLLYKNLDELIRISDTQLKRLPRKEHSSGRRSTSSRLFLTTDDNWYVGELQPASDGQPARMVTRDEHDISSSFEAEGERWRQQARDVSPRPDTIDQLRQMIDKTLAELPGYQRKILAFQRDGMLAADVEHMLVIKAEDLEHLAGRLQQLDGTAPELARLHAEALALRNEGRTLRINLVKQHAEPNQGHLEYLLEQEQVTLRRAGQRHQLTERDFLQEYEVVDTGHDTVLWYAHFHYRNLDTPFQQFSAAHLKRAEARYHGPQWQQQQAGTEAVWRGPISRQAADRYFAHL